MGVFFRHCSTANKCFGGVESGPENEQKEEIDVLEDQVALLSENMGGYIKVAVQTRKSL